MTVTIAGLAGQLVRKLQADMRTRWNRHVSVGDLLTDRWGTARRHGWGEGTSNNITFHHKQNGGVPGKDAGCPGRWRGAQALPAGAGA